MCFFKNICRSNYVEPRRFRGSALGPLHPPPPQSGTLSAPLDHACEGLRAMFTFIQQNLSYNLPKYNIQANNPACTFVTQMTHSSDLPLQQLPVCDRVQIHNIHPGIELLDHKLSVRNHGNLCVIITGIPSLCKEQDKKQCRHFITNSF